MQAVLSSVEDATANLRPTARAELEALVPASFRELATGLFSEFLKSRAGGLVHQLVLALARKGSSVEIPHRWKSVPLATLVDSACAGYQLLEDAVRDCSTQALPPQACLELFARARSPGDPRLQQLDWIVYNLMCGADAVVANGCIAGGIGMHSGTHMGGPDTIQDLVRGMGTLHEDVYDYTRTEIWTSLQCLGMLDALPHSLHAARMSCRNNRRSRLSLLTGICARAVCPPADYEHFMNLACRDRGTGDTMVQTAGLTNQNTRHTAPGIRAPEIRQRIFTGELILVPNSAHFIEALVQENARMRRLEYERLVVVEAESTMVPNGFIRRFYDHNHLWPTPENAGRLNMLQDNMIAAKQALHVYCRTHMPHQTNRIGQQIAGQLARAVEGEGC